MPYSPRLALPLIAAGQSQKDVTHNEALLAIDRLLALAVQSRDVAAPPASAADGQAWIVPAGAAAAWGHPAGTLVCRQGGGWIAQPVATGQLAMIVDETMLVVQADGWLPVRRVEAPAALALPTGGEVVDSQLRTAFAALVAVLQRHAIVA